MYSATPFPIWNEDKGSIWNKIYIVNVEDMYSLVRDEKYFGVKDCEFISILVSNEEVDYSNIYVDEELITMANGNYKRRPEWQGPNYYFDLGDEIKYLHSLKSTLPLLKLDANTFSYNFIPSYKRKITQYEIKNIIHNVYPTANVIIMNGNETGITLFRKTFSMDSNTTILEPSYQIDELLHRVRNIDNKPTFIVGFQTCNMSVTLIDEELGNFDNMIFYHDHLTKDPECLYQMMRIVFSYINWEIFSAHKIKKTKIYGHPAIHKIIIDYEEAVEKIELLEEGEYLRDEIQGNVPIKQNKKKEKRVNYLQQIPPEFIEYDKDAYAVNPKNESRKWKQLEEDYREFIGHDLSERSDPRTKRTKTGFILNGSMGGKYKGKHVSNTDLSSWVEGLSWYSNYAITKKYYKYIRVYVGYKDLEDPTKYTIHTRMVNLTKDEEVTRLLTSYEESDN